MDNNAINLEWGTPEIPQNASLAEAIQQEEQKSALVFENLPPNEQAIITDFSKKIDISDTNAISSYGADAQAKIAAFSESVLKNVRTKDTGEAGKLLSNLVVEIKNFGSESSDKPKFLSFIGNTKKKIDKLGANYSKVELNVDTISNSLESQRKILLKDCAMFDEMYENNYAYYKQLSMYIIAGRKKLEEINTVTIPELKAKADESKDEIDAQRYRDMVSSANRFERKLHDLALSRMVSIQMAPQIRLLQSNDIQLVDKIQSSIVNAIPLWKNQIVIALGLANAKSALEAQKKVSDMTNELLKKNSELLKQGTLEIAEESEKGIISIETIQKTNNDLIETISGVIEIQRSGHEKRMEAEQKLITMENEFKAALLNTGNAVQAAGK